VIKTGISEAKGERVQVKTWTFEQNDLNEHFRTITKNNTPVSTDHEVCLFCKTELIDTVRT